MLKRTTRFGVLSLLAVGSLLLNACDNATATPAPQTGPTATPTSDNRVEAKIGFAFVTSGDNAVYGASQRAAAELAIAEINAGGDGPRLVGLFEDTSSNPDQALAVFRKF